MKDAFIHSTNGVVCLKPEGQIEPNGFIYISYRFIVEEDVVEVELVVVLVVVVEEDECAGRR